ncbi:MAG TPA: hypothetical protein VF613_04290 [Longimicrobium sp.]|jgi:hypothetical protein
MATIERAVPRKLNKAELAAAVAKAVGAGRPAKVETVDFSDPNRPKTCLEVDFPILHINQVAAIEGNAGKPIYQMSKWWARRRSSVFRSMLLSASMKAPDDPAEAAKAVWDVYYANHQKKGAFKDLKVADIFMGGGTTLVEGSRLGMQMFGNDLNPVAWFVVKNELAQVDRGEVQALLEAVEAEVKPQIMPFYACDCPRGHKGVWTRRATGERMGPDFAPLALTPEQRPDYSYSGPEIIYVFWAKHGPCQVTGCGHRTPIMSSPVVALKTLTVKAWADYCCSRCSERFDVEESDARMAPGVPLVIANTENPFVVRDRLGGVTCPHCKEHERHPRFSGKPKSKKLELTLLVHPSWLAGTPKAGAHGVEGGGSTTDAAEATIRWSQARAEQVRLVEVRGTLPDEVTCPETGVTFRTDEGTVRQSGIFSCGSCGTSQRIVEAVEATGKDAPSAAYAVQGYCPTCDEQGRSYSGRFFSPASEASSESAAALEWETRRGGDLAGFWPTSEIPFGHMTHQRQPLPRHGYTHWWKMFNHRQLLVHAQLLRSIVQARPTTRWQTREYILGAYQQYLRNQNMFCFWDISRDCMAPHMSNNNYHPKSNVVENCVFPSLGRGNWASCTEALAESRDWAESPWELISNGQLAAADPSVALSLSGKSEKISCGDPVLDGVVSCGSSTELSQVPDGSLDLVITDPPFGGLLHYAELADFFYVWMRLALKNRYPEFFVPEYTPKTLEAVSNRARHPEDPDAFYKRLLTECWRESYRMLKPGGLLAFTFHHSEDNPWVDVLESLFDAGFYLEATYPIRSDETKGGGEFGSKTIEYDIIHVCRKRIEEPQPVSWGRMRREVLRDVRQLQQLLEHHTNAGLPAADVQVIKRGKALEYFSRHYGKVYVDEGREFTVREALIGINQLLDEETGKTQDPPPVNAEPITRQFLRLFDARTELPRDQMQKFLRGTGIAPAEFVEREWCTEQKKVFYPAQPLEFARKWHGQRRAMLTHDYDQAMVLIGACVDGSGINATETLRNPQFRPHPALKALLQWHAKRAGSPATRTAAQRAAQIYSSWEQQQPAAVKTQLAFFDAE